MADESKPMQTNFPTSLVFRRTKIANILAIRGRYITKCARPRFGSCRSLPLRHRRFGRQSTRVFSGTYRVPCCGHECQGLCQNGDDINKSLARMSKSHQEPLDFPCDCRYEAEVRPRTSTINDVAWRVWQR